MSWSQKYYYWSLRFWLENGLSSPDKAVTMLCVVGEKCGPVKLMLVPLRDFLSRHPNEPLLFCDAVHDDLAQDVLSEARAQLHSHLIEDGWVDVQAHIAEKAAREAFEKVRLKFGFTRRL